MGIMANYMMVGEEDLNKLVKLDIDDIIEYIENLDENGAEVYDMDKLWDGLHFFLCGISAGTPVEGDPLSEAIVGVHVFDDESDDFVGCTELSELPYIVKAMKAVDLELLKGNFDPSNYRKADIYPNIWVDSEKKNLLKELVSEFENLLAFYEKALEKKMHIIVSIY